MPLPVLRATCGSCCCILLPAGVYVPTQQYDEECAERRQLAARVEEMEAEAEAGVFFAANDEVAIRWALSFFPFFFQSIVSSSPFLLFFFFLSHSTLFLFLSCSPVPRS